MPYGYKQPGNWKTTTKRILARDAHCCYVCGAHATQVDHVVPVSAGGSHSDTNLAAICQPHHDEKSKRERTAGLKRHAARRKPDAEPHPGLLPPTALGRLPSPPGTAFRSGIAALPERPQIASLSDSQEVAR